MKLRPPSNYIRYRSLRITADRGIKDFPIAFSNFFIRIPLHIIAKPKAFEYAIKIQRILSINTGATIEIR